MQRIDAHGKVETDYLTRNRLLAACTGCPLRSTRVQQLTNVGSRKARGSIPLSASPAYRPSRIFGWLVPALLSPALGSPCLVDLVPPVSGSLSLRLRARTAAFFGRSSFARSLQRPPIQASFTPPSGHTFGISRGRHQSSPANLRFDDCLRPSRYPSRSRRSSFFSNVAIPVSQLTPEAVFSRNPASSSMLPSRDFAGDGACT